MQKYSDSGYATISLVKDGSEVNKQTRKDLFEIKREYDLSRTTKRTC